MNSEKKRREENWHNRMERKKNRNTTNKILKVNAVVKVNVNVFEVVVVFMFFVCQNSDGYSNSNSDELLL